MFDNKYVKFAAMAGGLYAAYLLYMKFKDAAKAGNTEPGTVAVGGQLKPLANDTPYVAR